jgi:hypothetical protein
MEAKIEANNQKFEVLQGTLIFQMAIYQARREAMQEKTDANLKEMMVEMRAWPRDEGLPTKAGGLSGK